MLISRTWNWLNRMVTLNVTLKSVVRCGSLTSICEGFTVHVSLSVFTLRSWHIVIFWWLMPNYLSSTVFLIVFISKFVGYDCLPPSPSLPNMPLVRQVWKTIPLVRVFAHRDPLFKESALHQPVTCFVTKVPENYRKLSVDKCKMQWWPLQRDFLLLALPKLLLNRGNTHAFYIFDICIHSHSHFSFRAQSEAW